MCDGCDIGSLCRLNAVKPDGNVSGVLKTKDQGIASLGKLGAVVSTESFHVDGHSESVIMGFGKQQQASIYTQCH